MREAQSMVAAVPGMPAAPIAKRRLSPKGADRGSQSRSSPWHAAISRRFREVAGTLTFREVARLTGSNWETTRRYMRSGSPSVRFLARFSEAFGVTADWLLRGSITGNLEPAPARAKAAPPLRLTVEMTNGRLRLLDSDSSEGRASRSRRTAPRRAVVAGARRRPAAG